tara:strand:- start:231 stop:608 length:378 start_codon:yes stop_codon:yes gene_type:complete
MDEFGGVLASTLGSMDQYQRDALQDALGVTALTPEQTAQEEEQRRVETERLDALGFTPQEKDMFFNGNMTVDEIQNLRLRGGGGEGTGGDMTYTDEELVTQYGLSPQEIAMYHQGLLPADIISRR